MPWTTILAFTYVSGVHDWVARFTSTKVLFAVAAAGAGKTNVAVLCILHELGLHRKADGSIDTSAFKIVYVAPMKALVAEMVGNFSTRLGEAYGLKVRELTGEEGVLWVIGGFFWG